MDVPRLAGLLREAEEHHVGYEATAPPHDWAEWYAAFVVARERGSTSDEAATEARRHMESLLR